MLKLAPVWLIIGVQLVGCGRPPDAPLADGDSQILLPDVRIDGYEHDLVPVSWLGISTNGTIAVVQTQDASVRFFSAEGEDLGTFGREGSGPGEFRRPIRGGWVGDSLWVSDVELHRVTLISPEYQLVRTLPPLESAVPAPGSEGALPEFSFVFPYGLLAGDTMIAMSAGLSDPAAFEGTPIIRVSSDAFVHDVVGEIPTNDCSIQVNFPGGSAGMTLPLCPAPLWTVAPDGAQLVVVTTDVTDASGGHYIVTTIDSRRNVEIESRSYAFEGEEIPSSVLDSVIAERVSRAQVPEMARAVESEGRDRIPPVYPPVRDVFVGSDGRLFLGLRENSMGRPWMILDRDGNVVDQFIVPNNVTLRAGNAEYAWGLERDDLDVESVVRFMLP